MMQNKYYEEKFPISFCECSVAVKMEMVRQNLFENAYANGDNIFLVLVFGFELVKDETYSVWN